MMILTVLQTSVKYFVEVPLLRFASFEMFHLMIELGLWIIGRSYRKNAILITSFQGYRLSVRLITINVDLDHLAKVLFVSFPTEKVTLSATPTLSILYTLERSQYMQPAPRSWELCFSISRVVSTSMNHVHDLYQWTLLWRRFVSSPPGLTGTRVILSTTSLSDSIKMFVFWVNSPSSFSISTPRPPQYA